MESDWESFERHFFDWLRRPLPSDFRAESEVVLQVIEKARKGLIELDDDRDDWVLALKFSNTCSPTNCARCGRLFEVWVGYCVTLREGFDCVCDQCVLRTFPEMLLARNAACTNATRG